MNVEIQFYDYTLYPVFRYIEIISKNFSRELNAGFKSDVAAFAITSRILVDFKDLTDSISRFDEENKGKE